MNPNRPGSPFQPTSQPYPLPYSDGQQRPDMSPVNQQMAQMNLSGYTNTVPNQQQVPYGTQPTLVPTVTTEPAPPVTAGQQAPTTVPVNGLELLSLAEAIQKYPNYQHMAVGALYSRPGTITTGPYRQPANILMIMDPGGAFEFPGGHLEQTDASIVDALNRELKEEINIKKKMEMNLNDYLYTSAYHKSGKIGHMYAREVPDHELTQLLKRIPQAKMWGTEVTGASIVPLYVQEDGFRGFPVFLSNAFSGPARENLINVIELRQLMHPQQLRELVAKSDQYLQKH